MKTFTVEVDEEKLGYSDYNGDSDLFQQRLNSIVEEMNNQADNNVAKQIALDIVKHKELPEIQAALLAIENAKRTEVSSVEKPE